MISFDRWTVSQLEIDIPTLSQLWLRLQAFPTLFSDTTRGDINLWISMIRDPSTVWYAVWEKEEMVGLLYFQLLDEGNEASVHMVFFDRRPAEKKHLCRMMAQLVFQSFPSIHRLFAEVPDIYYSTWRLAKEIGFKWEGTKREAVVIGEKWRNVHMYSLLRQEVEQWAG